MKSFGILLSLCWIAAAGAATRPSMDCLSPVYTGEGLSSDRMMEIASRVQAEVPKYRSAFAAFVAEAASAFAATPEALPAERMAKRLEMADRLCAFAEREARHGGFTGFGMAERALCELSAFERSFGDELSRWRENPANPKVSPVEIECRGTSAEDDFAAVFRTAMTRVRELKGRPSVVRIPEGVWTTRSESGEDGAKAQMLVEGVTNCLITGVAPDVTRIRLGVYDARGLLVRTSCNVTVANLEFALVKTPFLQGTVLTNETARDALVIRPAPGTLLPDDPCWTNRPDRQQYCSQSYDPATGLIDNKTTWTSYACRSERLGGDVWRIFFHPDKVYRHRLIKAGHVIAIPNRRNGYAATGITSSSFVTFSRVHVRSSRANAFGSFRSPMVAFSECRAFPLEGLVMSSNADGIFSSRSTFVRDCELRNMGDDGVNLLGRGVSLKTAGRVGAAYAVSGGGAGAEAFVLIDPSTGCARMNLSRTDLLPETTVTFDTLGRKPYTAEERRLITSQTVTETKTPDQLYAPTEDGVGGAVVRSRFICNRGAGIVIQSAHVLVEDSAALGVMGGVRLGSLARYQEGPPPYNCLLRRVRSEGGRFGFHAVFQVRDNGPAFCAPMRGIVWEKCHAANVDAFLRLQNVGESELTDCTFEDARTDGRRIQCLYTEDLRFRNCRLDGQSLTDGEIEERVCCPGLRIE